MFRIQSGFSLRETTSLTQNFFSSIAGNIVKISFIALGVISAFGLAFILFQKYQSSIKHEAKLLLEKQKEEEAQKKLLEESEKTAQLFQNQEWEDYSGGSNLFPMKDPVFPSKDPVNWNGSSNTFLDHQNSSPPHLYTDLYTDPVNWNGSSNTFVNHQNNPPQSHVETDEEKRKRIEKEESLSLIALQEEEQLQRALLLSETDTGNTTQSPNQDDIIPGTLGGTTSNPINIGQNTSQVTQGINQTSSTTIQGIIQPLSTPLPFQDFENIYAKIAEKVFTDPSFSAVHALKSIRAPSSAFGRQIPTLLNEIKRRFETKYQNELHEKLAIGEQVPDYFANVSDFETPIQKKYRSLVGMCNLFEQGPSIIDDLSEKKFLGGIHHYDKKKGLNAFKYFTGNTVDLDVELTEKKPEEALTQAKKLIVQFGKACGLSGKDGNELTAEEVNRLLPNRKLDLPSDENYIHDVGQDNKDRSNYGIWKRQNPTSKEKFYYVNVPKIEIVMVAVLKLPYMLAELLDKAKMFQSGKLYDEFCDAFFEDGLSTACFNDKANTMIEFHNEWKFKLEGALTPEEEVTQKIEKGDFGQAMQKEGAVSALKKMQSRDSLIILLSDIEALEDKNISFKDWNLKEIDHVRNILIQKGLWESVLYQRRKDENGKIRDDDYFLLNESTLKSFMVDLYEYLLNL